MRGIWFLLVVRDVGAEEWRMLEEMEMEMEM